jgi:hypothetical protein
MITSVGIFFSRWLETALAGRILLFKRFLNHTMLTTAAAMRRPRSPKENGGFTPKKTSEVDLEIAEMNAVLLNPVEIGTLLLRSPPT